MKLVPFLQSMNPYWFILIVFLFMALCFVIDRLKDKSSKLMLIVLSVIIIGCVDVYSAVYLLIISNISYFLIKKQLSIRHKLNFAAFVLIGILIGYKFYQVVSSHFSYFSFAIFLGISYYTFRISATLFDAARNNFPSVNYIDYLNYCFFFPIFIGGPIQRYQSFKKISHSFSYNFRSGFARFLFGIVKKLLIADLIIMFVIRWLKSLIYNDTSFHIGGYAWGMTATQVSIFLLVLFFGFVNIIRAYFDLSALTDIAIGLSRCFGYQVSENFNKPLLTTNIIQFWRCWHMTIAAWARDYIFSPFLLKFRNVVIAVAVTMLCMGIWHQPSLRWIFWGVGHGLGLIICGAWQRTKLYQHVQTIRNKLYSFSYEVVFIAPYLFKNKKNEYVYSSSELVESHPIEKKVLRLNLSFLSGLLAFVFFDLPAWVINFAYMSFIFIAVSCPSAAEAIKLYKIMFGG